MIRRIIVGQGLALAAALAAAQVIEVRRPQEIPEEPRLIKGSQKRDWEQREKPKHRKRRRRPS